MSSLCAFIFLFALTVEISSFHCDLEVRMKQLLLHEGFHRNLTYVLQFSALKHGQSSTDWFDSCMVGLEQQLPAGVFVNPDELGDLRRLGKVNAFPRNKVNVELSAEEASESSAYVIGRVHSGHAELWMPVHARYHRPQEHTSVALNIIQPPRVYVQCADGRLDPCASRDDRPSALCPRRDNECGWRRLPHETTTSPIRWEVPIGDLTHTTAVTLGTVVVVLLGALYLLRSIHQFKRAGTKKNS